jgi:hypothetical protein
MGDEKPRHEPQDERDDLASKGGSGGSADVAPAVPADDDDSALGDTDQHSEADA